RSHESPADRKTIKVPGGPEHEYENEYRPCGTEYEYESRWMLAAGLSVAAFPLVAASGRVVFFMV
ncbi:MAG: hypothetical protein V2A76_02980, partial [Planctomycetota bacterium]